MLGHRLILRILELLDDTSAGSLSAPSDPSSQPSSAEGGHLPTTNEDEEMDLRSPYEKQFLLEMQAKRYEQLKYYFQNARAGSGTGSVPSGTSGGSPSAAAASDSPPPIEIQDVKQVKTRLP